MYNINSNQVAKFFRRPDCEALDKWEVFLRTQELSHFVRRQEIPYTGVH